MLSKNVKKFKQAQNRYRYGMGVIIIMMERGFESAIEKLRSESHRMELQLEDLLSMLLDFLRAEKGSFGLSVSLRHGDYESSINTVVEEVKITKNSIYVRGDNTDLLLSIKKLPE